MINSKKEKRFSTLSEQLTEMFKSMDQINVVYKKIELSIEQEYQVIEKKVNPDKDNDLSSELRYHMAGFLKNMARNYESKNNFDD